jgi:NADP-dependent 3-hydroxy acid dehydrogenase YdfG
MRRVAIIPDASSAIGEASAMKARGTQVVLMARSADRLTALPDGVPTTRK